MGMDLMGARIYGYGVDIRRDLFIWRLRDLISVYIRVYPWRFSGGAVGVGKGHIMVSYVGGTADDDEWIAIASGRLRKPQEDFEVDHEEHDTQARLLSISFFVDERVMIITMFSRVSHIF